MISEFCTYIDGWNEDDEPIRLSISNFDDDAHCHIHGELIIEFDDERIKTMGFSDLEDCCFNEWIVELSEMIAQIDAGEPQYLYEDMGQGQPNYLFEKDKENLLLTVYTDFTADEQGKRILNNWNKRAVNFSVFKIEYQKLHELFLNKLKTEIPKINHNLIDKFYNT